MKSLNSLLLAAVSSLTLLSACTSRSPYSSDTISFALMSQSKTYTLTESAEVFGQDADLTFVDSVCLLMPTLSGKADLTALQDSIMKEAFDSTGIDQQAVINAFFEKVNAETGFVAKSSSKSESAYEADGFVVVRGTIIYLSPNIMVYCVTNESMQPHAAHGITLKTYINYLVKENKIIGLEDIFTLEGLSELPRLIAQRATNEAAMFGPTDITALPSNGNFYISPNCEIVFAYQPYEVASYAQGAINISFLPYELVAYMTPEAIKIFGLYDFVK